MDISHNLSGNDRLHGYYGFNYTQTIEPNGRGNTVPGFGYVQRRQRQFFSLNETHTFGRNRINELRFGLNRLSSSTRANAQLNPADFGIRDGIAAAHRTAADQHCRRRSQLRRAVAPSHRGAATRPSWRADTMSCLCGRHSLKIGGEFRQFLNNNFRLGTGAFNFPSVAAFLADTANSFSVTLGNQIEQHRARGFRLLRPGQLQDGGRTSRSSSACATTGT